MTAARRIAIEVAGTVWDEWTAVEIIRDLAELSGSFWLELRDSARSTAAFPFATTAWTVAQAVKPGMTATVTVDGEPVLIGYVDEVIATAAEGDAWVELIGRDKTADLVDCTAAPTGPSEHNNIDLLAIAQRLAEPFGISVRAEVDVGERFARFVVDAAEPARAAIEKAARQRAVLVTSDGVGGLVLTRGGSTRAAGALQFPGNVIESEGRYAWQERYGDYYVLGQAEKAAQLDRSAAQLDARAAPRDTPVEVATDAEKAGVVITGHARDEMIGRYRPIVSVARMQTTAAPAQTTADWMMRTARARAQVLKLTCKDYRAGGALWRPNQLVFVDDRYQGVYRDMLIAAVAYRWGERGATTRLTLVGPASFDLLPEAAREQNHAQPRVLDRSAEALP